MERKILHISKYYYPFMGGMEQIARDCVNSLKDDDVIQKVICFNHLKGDCEDYVDEVNVIRCGTQAKIASQSLSVSYCNRLKKTIKEFEPNYIVFHYPNPFVAHFLLKFIKNSNVKLILYWHLDITKQKILGRLFEKQNTKLLQRSYRIIATSPNYINGSKYLTKYVDKCCVVPNCINTDRLKVNDNVKKLSEEIKEKNSGKIICFALGRHTKYKGMEYLIRASKLLDDNFSIYIAGKGELTDSLHKLAKDDRKVQFLGLISDDELKAYLLACDIFCFPSITKNEAFGVALAEAMYFNNPCVTFNIKGSGVNYVNLDGVTGIEVENKNVIKYSEAIKKLGNDEKLRQEMGYNAQKRVCSEFLLSSYQKKIRDFFTE